MVDMQLVVTGVAMAVFAANYLGSKTNQAKILKKITKKQHGLIRLHTGKSTISRVINFENDKFVVGDKTYLKTPEAITVEKDGKKDPKQITKDMINMEDGVPVIDFDIDSIMPKTFCQSSDTENEKKIDATPEQITAIFKKERALAKAEAYDANKDELKKLVMICALAAVVAAGLAYFAYDNTNTINARLNILHNGTQMIGAALNISVP